MTNPENRNFSAKILSTWVSQFWAILWKSLPIGSLLAGILFWKYLSNIGRPDLLLPCLSNPSGMASFLLVFSLMAILGVYVLATPSGFLTFQSRSIEKEIGKEAAAALLNGIFWLGLGTAMIPILMLKGAAGWSILLGPLIGILLHFLWLRTRHKGRITQMFPCKDKNTWRPYLQGSYYVAVLLIGGVLTLLPMFMVLPFIGTNSDAWWANLADIGILVLIALTALLPALMYCLVASTNHASKSPVFAFAAGVVVLVGLFVILAPPATEKIMNKAASEIGLRVDSPHRYVLHTERLDVDLLDSTKWDISKHINSTSVNAVIPLAMGELVLLCPVDHKKSITMTHDSDECIVFKNDEVIRIPQIITKVDE